MKKFDYIIFSFIVLSVGFLALSKIADGENRMFDIDDDIVDASSDEVKFHRYTEKNQTIEVRTYIDNQWAEQMPLDSKSLTNDIIDAFSVQIDVFDDYNALLATAKLMRDKNIPYYSRVIQISPQIIGLYHGPFVDMENAQIAKQKMEAENIVASSIKIVPYRSTR